MNLTEQEAWALLDIIRDDERGEYDVDLSSVIRFLIQREIRREEYKTA